MKLSEELQWRGYINQSTLDKINVVDKQPIKFYLGVDPSSDSMTIGNLAALRMADCMVRHGHQGFMLVGGATGMIGDPDGKKTERELKTVEEININKHKLESQIKKLFSGKRVEIVDNYDWFKDINYLDFLRDIGKNVPLRQMIARDFVSTRLKDENAGLSYAEFSYALIQAYDFLHLYKVKNVTMQICGSDQWGNSIAGVDLIRRKTGGEAHVLSMPLIINKQTGIKFGKSESGAIWLDANKTTPTQFYQFWVNIDDDSVEDFLKIYTDLDKTKIENIMKNHSQNPALRLAQKTLAEEISQWVHGDKQTKEAIIVTKFLTGEQPIGEADDTAIEILKNELPSVKTTSLVDALVKSALASSNTEARRLIKGNAISVNGKKTVNENIASDDYLNDKALIRRGKAFKDSALVEKP